MTDPKTSKQEADTIKLRVPGEQSTESHTAQVPSLQSVQPVQTSSSVSPNPVKSPGDVLANPNAAEHEWLSAAHALNEQESKGKPRGKFKRNAAIAIIGIIAASARAYH